MERPLTPLLCAFIAGITVGHLCRVADHPLVISLLLVLMLLLAASIKKSANLIAILVVVSSALLGIVSLPGTRREAYNQLCRQREAYS